MRFEKDPAVYILASRRHGTLYIGVTCDLHGRMQKHKQGYFEGFAKRYGVTMLVYYEMHDDMDAAIRREKRLKTWNRAWKLRLIETMNPEWIELYDEQDNGLRNGPPDVARGLQTDGEYRPGWAPAFAGVTNGVGARCPLHSKKTEGPGAVLPVGAWGESPIRDASGGTRSVPVLASHHHPQPEAAPWRRKHPHRQRKNPVK